MQLSLAGMIIAPANQHQFAQSGTWVQGAEQAQAGEVVKGSGHS